LEARYASARWSFKIYKLCIWQIECK
jgi:hypothetical protein